jgi:paraquat-inducible protein A
MGNESAANLQERRALAACPECDLLLDLLPVPPRRGRAVVCPRCGALLYKRGSLEKTLAIACAALVLLALGIAFPVIGLEINGQRTEATVFDAVAVLSRQGMPAIAVLVLLTTTVVPLLELVAAIWLVLPLHFGHRPPAFVGVFRALQRVRPWAMAEVFLLGILVAMVKLSHLAELLPGIAMWSFGGLMLLLTALTEFAQPRELWRTWQAIDK